jgi:MinD-like ATPase involved in chromosome partitioning or flagellar assembly/ActR/RegA family two-component response regulator
MNTEPNSILVIDGDAASRNYLNVMLRKNGYTVLLASLGREGLISAWKDRPDIILLDPELPDLPGLELVTRLRQDHRTSKVPVVALSSLQDSLDKNALLSAGCSYYLSKSSEALSQLLELFPRILREDLAVTRKRGILEVFLSAKGGTGTSSLCANIAMCLGSENIETRVAVVDLVLPIGSIADIVGYNDKFNLVTVANENPAITNAGYFRDYLPRVPNWYFHLLAGSPDPESANQLAVNRLDGIISAIIDSYDYILIDLGRGLSRISLPIIQMADVVVLVVGTDLSTAILTRTVWDYLKTQGIEPKRLFPLQNRAVGLEGLTKNELEQMTGTQIRLTLPYMSSNFTVANNRHEPLITKFPNDSSSFTLKEAAIQIAELGQHSRNW